MKQSKLYYHLLEFGNYGKIAHVNYFLIESEAKKELNRLLSFFPNNHYEIHATNSRREPVVVNC
jgi:hypothetical protein